MAPCYQEILSATQRGGGGRESNPPATILAAKPVLKTGGATGPLPPPPPLFIRYLQRSAQSQARQSAHLPPTIFDFGFPGSNSGFALRECALAIAQALGGKLSLDERF